MRKGITVEEETSIAVVVDANPSLVLINADTRELFLAHVRKEIWEFKGNVKTASGRKEKASFAHKVTRTKTAIDNAGKALNENARAQITAVDAVRRELRETLDSLRDEVRAPLTEWEVAEKTRVETRDNTLRIISQACIPIPGETSASIADRLEQLNCIHIYKEVFQEGTESAIQALAESTEQVVALLDRAKSEEAAKAELEKLRAEVAAREKADREKAEAAAAAERIQKLRAKKEQEEAERQEAMKRRAQEEATQIAEAKLAEANERARLAQEAKERDEARRRENFEHREKIKGEATSAMEKLGVPATDASVFFDYVAAGRIPHMKVQF
jgi:septal ring factor EnvC (AmiA/AmiB activator)